MSPAGLTLSDPRLCSAGQGEVDRLRGERTMRWWRNDEDRKCKLVWTENRKYRGREKVSKWGCSGTKHSLKHPYKKKGCWGLIFFSSRHNAVLMLWLGSGVKKHVVILRTTLCFSWKCLFNSPQAWLEMSWGILKSTQFCHLKRGSKWPDFLWKKCGFGCHKHGRKCPQAFLKKLILWLQIWL